MGKAVETRKVSGSEMAATTWPSRSDPKGRSREGFLGPYVGIGVAFWGP